MTVVLLASGWLALAFLVGEKGKAALWARLPSPTQARVALTASLGLAFVPVSALIVLFWESLPSVGAGPPARRCGRLIVAILTDPLSRPTATAALLLLMALLARLWLGTASAWRSQRGCRTLAKRVGARGVVVGCDEPIAFTAGLLRPRVVVSDGLLSSVSPDLAEAVLAHEEAHRRGLHPLGVFVVESMARGLPLHPLRRAADAYRLSLESVADERAAERVGSREVVAEAVAAVALSRTEALGFEGNEVQRVRRLLSRPDPAPAFTGPVVGLALLGLTAFAGGHAVHCAAASLEAVKPVQCRMR